MYLCNEWKYSSLYMHRECCSIQDGGFLPWAKKMVETAESKCYCIVWDVSMSNVSVFNMVWMYKRFDVKIQTIFCLAVAYSTCIPSPFKLLWQLILDDFPILGWLHDPYYCMQVWKVGRLSFIFYHIKITVYCHKWITVGSQISRPVRGAS